MFNFTKIIKIISIINYLDNKLNLLKIDFYNIFFKIIVIIIKIFEYKNFWYSLGNTLKIFDFIKILVKLKVLYIFIKEYLN